MNTEAAVVINSSFPSTIVTSAAAAAAAVAVAAEVEVIKTAESMLTNLDQQSILDFDKYALFLFFFISVLCIAVFFHTLCTYISVCVLTFVLH